MFSSCILIHLMFVCVTAVTVTRDSPPLFSYVNMKQVTVTALPDEASVICDSSDCDKDFVNLDYKLHRTLTRTPPLRHLSIKEVDVRQGNQAVLKGHGSDDSRTTLNHLDLPSYPQGEATREGEKEELVETVDASEILPTLTPIDSTWPDVHSRERRSIRNMALFRRAFKDIGLKGRVLYTAKKVTQLKFQFDSVQFHDISSDDVTLADLRLYQRSQRKRQRNRRRRHRGVTVRVSIHQMVSSNRRFPHAKLIDSRLLHIGKPGWVNFNVTAAVKDWLSSSYTNKGIEVWAESVKGGQKAARAVRKLKFVGSGSKKRKAKSPAVVLYLRTVK